MMNGGRRHRAVVDVEEEDDDDFESRFNLYRTRHQSAIGKTRPCIVHCRHYIALIICISYY